VSGGTTIVREAPRGRRTGGRASAGFVPPVPSFRVLVRPALDELRLAALAYPGLMVGSIAAGMILWPATVAGLALIVPPIISFRDGPPTPAQWTAWYAGAGLVAGALAGTVQWLALRRAVAGAPLWAPLTALGWAAAMAAAPNGASVVQTWIRAARNGGRFTFWAPQWELPLVLAILGAMMGLLLGTAQWVALRRGAAPFRRRRVWPLASTLAWSFGLALVPLLPRAPDFIQRTGRYSGGFDFTMPALVLAGAFYGLLTGFALTLMLRAAAPRPVET
jgi:hypothetical protein